MHSQPDRVKPVWKITTKIAESKLLQPLHVLLLKLVSQSLEILRPHAAASRGTTWRQSLQRISQSSQMLDWRMFGDTVRQRAPSGWILGLHLLSDGWTVHACQPMTCDSLHCSRDLARRYQSKNISSFLFQVIPLRLAMTSSVSPFFFVHQNLPIFFPKINQTTPVSSTHASKPFRDLLPPISTSPGWPPQQSFWQEEPPTEGKSCLQV